MRKAARSFMDEPLDSSDLLRLRHIPLLALPYYPADLQSLLASSIESLECVLLPTTRVWILHQNSQLQERGWSEEQPLSRCRAIWIQR